MHPARLCGGFRTIFFLLSVLVALKKKNNNNYPRNLAQWYQIESRDVRITVIHVILLLFMLIMCLSVYTLLKSR